MKRNFISFLKFGVIAFTLTGMAFMIGCNNDDEPEVDPLVGEYKLTTATYLGLFNPTDGSTAEVTMTIEGIGEIPVSSPVSEVVVGVLNGIPECENPTAVQIEFREDGTLWITCDGVGDSQSGTWSKDGTTVSLEIAPTDALPTGLLLNIGNVSITAASLSGRVDGFPMPMTLLESLGPTNIQFISANITLVKQ